MIAQLSGIIVSKTTSSVVVQCGGVGYVAGISLNTSEKLPAIGEIATLLTTMIVREDAMLLYGFYSEAERDIFALLTSISGIGPKIAMAMLSATSLSDLQDIISRNDAVSLQKIPGIGKKTAEIIIVQLRDKIGKVEGIQSETDVLETATNNEVRRDVLDALQALGYSRVLAEKAVKQAVSAEPAVRFSVEQLMRKALKFTMK